MLSAKSQYTYFENLEKTIKLGLAVYLTLFCLGTSVALLGAERIVDFVRTIPLSWLIIILMGAGLILFGAFRSMKAIHWLGDVHIWLDEKFFGFLKRSNEIIFGELTYALEPDERTSIVSIEPGARGALAKSIFSQLASDNELFGALLHSGIFRYWIWYWITLYGTCVFTVLTLESFTGVLIGLGVDAKTLFAANWAFALVHLVLSLVLGYHLVRMTKRTVDAIVQSHKDEIATILRANITKYQTSV
ncbi:MAG: hypothetical protein HYR76_08360 [Ignavibacteria bacterium]|nr:hypothetical protein [Ignavibacteria bacterium]